VHYVGYYTVKILCEWDVVVFGISRVDYSGSATATGTFYE
jgi:hypothetical protein